MTNRRTGLVTLAAVAGLALPPRLLSAQPTRMRILCAAPAGGSPDLVARRYAEAMAPRFPQGVVVENRPGAAGLIAISALRQSAADGTTMLLAHGGVATVYPHLYSRLAYDPAVDLAPVAMAAETAFALAVGPQVPASVTDLSGLIDWARSVRLSYGTPGQGTLPHLLTAHWARSVGVAAQHVPYAGGPAVIGDLIGGQLAAAVLPEGLLLPHHQAGRLRLLASSGAVRNSRTPQVATFAEQGFAQEVGREWFAFFMPGATAADAVERVGQAVMVAAASPALAAALAEQDMPAIVGSAAEARRRMAAEGPHWRTVITSLGLRIE
jgi:tripartite-type tricarboxylate transporter receptor subunit TctC